MAASFKTTRRVEFVDTDAAGIIHFATYFTMMEQAEHECRRQLGLGVMTRDEEGIVSWPRVSASCDFHEAVRFEDELEIEVRISSLGETSVTYTFTFTHQDRRIATGEMTSVCCRIAEGKPPKSMPIPDAVRAKLMSM